MVVGIRHTSSDVRTNRDCGAPEYDGERLEGHHGEQEHDRQARQQDVEGDFVGGLLALGALHERDHPIQKGVAGVRRHPDLDPVRQHLGAGGHGRSIAAGLADDRGRLARHRRLVHRRHAFGDLAVAGNELAGRHEHDVPAPQARRRDHLDGAVPTQALASCLGPAAAERIRLCLPPALGHRLRKVGEQDGQPEPARDLALETKTRSAGHRVADEPRRGQRAADLDDEHHRIARHHARVQLPDRLADRAPDDAGIPDGRRAGRSGHGLRTWCRRASAGARPSGPG